jgi:hypothetical protein
MARPKPKPFIAAPGGLDMSRQEAFARVFRLARSALGGGHPEDRDRDLTAIKFIEDLAHGSHNYIREAANG